MPYSHPQSLDKATIYREWKHILPGAMALAGTAGYVNSVVLGFFATPVSHMSGAVSHLGLDMAASHFSESYLSLVIIFGFVLGAVLAGILVGATKLVPSRRYGAVLMFEGALLCVSSLLLVRSSPLGPLFAAMACGLQNGMSSSYCGLMIRTTHVTGVVTDLGVMIGHWLRHKRIVVWKLRFLVALLVSFGLGGLIGACLDLIYGPRCLFLAAAGCFTAGAVFFAVMQQQPKSEDDTQTDEDMPPRTSIFPDSF